VVSMGACGLLDAWLFALIVGRDVGIVAGSFALRFKRFGWQWPRGGAREFFSLDADDHGGGISTIETTTTGRTTKTRPASPLFISKVNTVAQLGLVSGALMNAWTGWPSGELVTGVLGPVTAVTTVASGLAYVDAYRTGRVKI